MLSLDTVQSRMRDALLSPSGQPLVDILGSSAGRFDIHRRHFIQSLTAALENTFPATVNLVDSRFFGFAADAFIRAHPPTEPCLFEYGVELPGFLDSFPACASLPYLADVARLEWAMHSVFHAETDHEGLGFAAKLFSSPWPVDAIWRLAMGRSEAPVDINSGCAWVLIYRKAMEVKFESLSHASFVFHSIIQKRGEVSFALAEAKRIDPNFDKREALAQLQRADIFQANP